MKSFILSIIGILIFSSGFTQSLSLVSPSNRTILDTTNVLFTWNSFSGTGITYNLQYADDSLFSTNVQNINNISKDTIALNTFILGNSYFWHIRAFNGSTYSNWSNCRKFTIINPSLYPNLQLWLKADKGVSLNGSTVDTLKDQSTNHFIYTQSVSGSQPLLTTGTSSKPTLHFSGSTFLAGPIISGINNSSVTFFSIASGSTYSNNDLLGLFTVGTNRGFSFDRWVLHNTLLWINNNNIGFSTGNISQTGFTDKIFSCTKNFGNTSNIYINGSLQGSSSDPTITGAFTNDITYLGTEKGSYGNGWVGNISEVILYSSVLSDNSRQNIESYLRYKYYPPVNLGHDITLSNFCHDTLDAGKWFVHYKWSTGNAADTLHYLAVNTSGTYSVIATDVFGIKSYDTVKVIYPQITLHDTAFCAGSSVTLSTGLSGTNTYLWSNSLTTSTINVNTAGNYSVTVSPGTSCSEASPVIHVSVDSLPLKASLGPPHDTICSGNIIGLISPSPLPAGLTYLWTGGATTSSIAIINSGSYTVTVNDNNGCSVADNINIYVSGYAPTPAFSFTKVCSGQTTQFTDASSTPKDNWLWDFGDPSSGVNNTSTLQNPTHTYISGNSYTVSLTVGNGVCKNTIVKTVHIPVPPIAAFTVDTACISKPYDFTDNSSCTEGHIISWSWNFGEPSSGVNNTSNAQNPKHKYSSHGTYTVSLSIATDSGCTNTISHQIIVVDSAPPPMPFTTYLPSNGFISTSHNINFAWNASQRAASYTLEYSTDSLFVSNITNVPNITNNSTQQIISISQKYYWRVIAFGICGDSLISNIFKFTIFQLNSINGLTLWLMGDSAHVNGGKVDTLFDCSGNNNNFIQTNASLQPVFITGSSPLPPTLSYNGSKSLSGPVISGLNNSSVTFFSVASGSAYSNNELLGLFTVGTNRGFSFDRWTINNILLWINNNSLGFSAGNFPQSGFPNKILSCTKNFGNLSNIYINGSLQGSSTDPTIIGTFTNDITYVGTEKGSYGNGWQGNISEIIIYNKALSTSDRQSVENYLHNKYAPPVNLGPDITKNNFCPDTLEAGKRFIHYKWSTGNAADTLHYLAVNTSGTYSVIATDVFGIKSYDTVKVIYPQITLHDTAFCAGSSVVLSIGLSGAFTYLWSNTQTTSTINVNTDGNYSVTVSPGTLCSAASPVIHVKEDSLPITASLGKDTSICTGNTIGLVSPMPLPPGLTYHWSDSETTSTIAINTAGTYSLTVSDGYGCIASDNITIGLAGTAPSVSFTYQKACSGDTTKFTNTSTPVGTSWLWNFGDAHTSTSQNPHHVYSAGGNFNVTLTVHDGICSNNFHKTIHIPKSPVAAFTVDIACINNPYNFTDNSICNEGHIISCLWNFGDGHFSHAQDTSYKYITAGTYTVSLTVITDSGCTAIASHQITVVSTASSPMPFTLYLPSNGFISSSHTINFAWNTSPGAASYTLEYSTDSLFVNNVTSIPNINTTSSQQNINTEQTYYWRVLAFNLCGNSTLYNGYYSFTIFSPDTLQGLSLWLKADAGIDTIGNFVNQWNDQSSNAYNASQSTASQRPQLIYHIPLLNNYPALKFDGSKSLSGPVITGLNNSSITLFFVISGDSYPNNELLGIFTVGTNRNFSIDRWIQNNTLLWLNNNDISFSAGNFPQSGFPDRILTCTKNFGNASTIYINGSLQGSSSNPIITGTFTNDVIYIGTENGSYGNGWKGNIAEILIYNSALSTPDKQSVENYLHNKYAPPVNLGPDITTSNLCPITLEAGNRFVHYKWNTGNPADTLHYLLVNLGGTYIVTATDVFGFKSSDTVIVHKPSIAAHDTMGCYGNSITLNSGLSAPYTFSWNNGSTASSITVAAPSNDTLTVTDQVGCHATKYIHVKADSFALKSSLGTFPITKCAGDSVYLVTGAGAAVSYDWWDGTAHTYVTAYPIIWTTGNHAINLTVTDTMGCTATFSPTIYVKGIQPTVGFSYVPVCFLPNSSILTIFDDTSSTVAGCSITNYYWNFGDSTTAEYYNSNQFTHTYPKDGYYTVTLTDTTNKGCYKSFTHQVPVYSTPKPAFTPHLGCSGVPIDIKDKSVSLVGNINTWNWQITDPLNTPNPDTSTKNKIIHTFDSTGYYDVKLIVTTQYGCKDSITDSVKIRFAPKIGFSYTSVCDGNPVYFNDTTNTQPWASITNRRWNFGNGDSSTIINPVVTYNGAGIYNVSLTDNIINGCVVTDTIPVVVHAIPVAKFIANDICAQSPYTFYDSSTVAFPDNIASWLWNFGNGNTSNIKNPVTIFPDSNAYFVSLNITSNAGCKDSTVNKVHINPIPKASFMPDNFYGVAPFTVTFNNNSQDALNYLWNFGDTTANSIDVNPVHNYTSNGIYNVILIAYNQYGCTSDTTQQLMVIPTIGDIAVSNVNLIKNDNGYDSLSAEITNLGSRRVYQMNIYAKTENGTSFMETWTNYSKPLEPGVTMTYTFNELYKFSTATHYVCVEAEITNYNPDDNPLNNEQCVTDTNQFSLITSYPNPVHDELNINFILPTSFNESTDLVMIELYGTKGEKLKTIYPANMAAGLNRYILDVSALNLAAYTYRITYNGNVLINKFVKY